MEVSGFENYGPPLVVDMSHDSDVLQYDSAFIENLTIGGFYQARQPDSKTWDLSTLQQVDVLEDGSVVGLVKWSCSGLKQVVPITPATFQELNKKRERKSKFNLFDEENHLRGLIGMKKLKKASYEDEVASTTVKAEKREVVHRPLKEGMLPADVVHEAADKCAFSLRSHANALRPFISPKVYAQLISFKDGDVPSARSSPGDSLYFKAEPDVVTADDTTLPAIDSITSLCSLGSFRSQAVPSLPSSPAPVASFRPMPTTPLEGTPAQVAVPSTIKATLRDYQVRGVSWLVDRYDRCINAILADEMGLGKTLQTITFFAYLKESRREAGPHLVVVPLSVMFNWVTELKKFCPSLRILRVHSNNPAECKTLRERMQDVTQYDVVVTSYEMLKGGMESAFSRMVWRSVVLDEGHRIKNMLTQLSRVCIKLRARFKIILTGTPVQNNLSETYALLHYMMPTIFDTDCGDAFATCFSLSGWGANGTTGTTAGNSSSSTSSAAAGAAGAAGAASTGPTHNEAGARLTKVQIDRQALSAAHYMLRPFVLRRIKTEVEQKLPPKLETMIKCPLSDMQRFWIKALLMRESTALMGHFAEHSVETADTADKSRFWKRLQSLLAQLRKAANHPYLFPGAEGEVSATTGTSEEIVTASGKMVILDRLLHKLHERGHRVVLFSQFTRTLDIISDYLDMRGYSHCRLDGSTHRVMREVLINQFNKPASKLFVFCLSTRAGGEGVNLFTADTVILFDSDWNPQVDIQAMARVHRIGQTRPVHIYRLVSQGTVEERIVQRAQKKLFLDCMVNRGSTAQSQEIDRQVEEARRARALHHHTHHAQSSSVVGDSDAGDSSDAAAASSSSAPSAATATAAGASSAAPALKDDGADDIDTSTAMAALKFGWNACFAGSNSTDGHCSISDEALDAIIDRTRRSNTAVTQLLEKEQSQSPSSGPNSQPQQQRQRVKKPKGRPEPMYQASDSMVKKARSILSSSASSASSNCGEGDIDSDGACVEGGEDSDDLVLGDSGGCNKNLFPDNTHNIAAPVVPLRSTAGTLNIHAKSPLQSPAKIKAKSTVKSPAKAKTSAAASTFLQEGQEHSVLEFEETAPMVELRCFEGEVLNKKQVASLGDISSLWIIQQNENEQRAKRDRQSRLEQVHVANVGLVNVLKVNNYTLEDGEPSVFDAEAKRHKEWAIAGRTAGAKNKRTFKHQDHCQHCWDYGKLICCTYCPASYHLKCVGLSVVPTSMWSCPHHGGCVSCGQFNQTRSFAFRCEMCANSYCEDCLPADHVIIGVCERWQALGFNTPVTTCYIHCSESCAKFAAYQDPLTSSSGGESDVDDDVIVLQDSAVKAPNPDRAIDSDDSQEPDKPNKPQRKRKFKHTRKFLEKQRRNKEQKEKDRRKALKKAKKEPGVHKRRLKKLYYEKFK